MDVVLESLLGHKNSLFKGKETDGMNGSNVLSQGPSDTNNADFYISNKGKTMKSKDLEKYFGALKDCTILDEIRAQIIK